jgi:RNA polymerase sigma-70 factor (ECF subfamily)
MVIAMTGEPIVFDGIEPINRDAPDGALAAAVTRGDNRAFESLFHVYYDRLCAFAESQVRSSAIAEELVEDVFCWIWEHRADWGAQLAGGGVRPYLYAAVRNRALRYLARQQVARRERTLAESELSSLGMGAASPPQLDAVEASDFARAVERAVAGLPSRCREAFALHRHHELSYAEIARVMGISTRTVENHLAKALKTLRMSLAAWRPGADSIAARRD